MNSPELRFKGFLDEWEMLSLKECGLFRSNGVDKKVNPDEIPVFLLNYMDIYNKKDITPANYKDLMKVTAKPSQLKDCSVVEGDVFITPTSETSEDIGHSKVVEMTIPNTVYSYHLMRFRPFKNAFYITFPNFCFESNSVRNQFQLSAQGVQRYVISKADFENTKISKPKNLLEQKSISDLLTNIDTRISCLEKKLFKFNVFKKTIKSKLYFTDKNNLPKLRFKMFNDKWTKTKLSKCILFNRFPQISANDLLKLNTNEGDVTLLPSSRNFDWKCNSGNCNQQIFEGQVITVGRARNANTKFCSGKFISSQNHIIESNNVKLFLPYFLYHFISLHEKEFYSAESTYPMFTKTDFDDLDFSYPNEKEQNKLCDLLKTFDDLTKLYAIELNKMKKLQKAILNKLFI